MLFENAPSIPTDVARDFSSCVTSSGVVVSLAIYIPPAFATELIGRSYRHNHHPSYPHRFDADELLDFSSVILHGVARALFPQQLSEILLLCRCVALALSLDLISKASS